jgi:hypothetical protein
LAGSAPRRRPAAQQTLKFLRAAAEAGHAGSPIRLEPADKGPYVDDLPGLGRNDSLGSDDRRNLPISEPLAPKIVRSRRHQYRSRSRSRREPSGHRWRFADCGQLAVCCGR